MLWKYYGNFENAESIFQLFEESRFLLKIFVLHLWAPTIKQIEILEISDFKLLLVLEQLP